MKRKLRVITMASLVVGTMLLAEGFVRYSKEFMKHSTIESEDRGVRLEIDEQDDGTSFAVLEYDKKGNLDKITRRQGALQKVMLEGKGETYSVAYEEQAVRKVERIHSVSK